MLYRVCKPFGIKSESYINKRKNLNFIKRNRPGPLDVIIARSTCQWCYQPLYSLVSRPPPLALPSAVQRPHGPPSTPSAVPLLTILVRGADSVLQTLRLFSVRYGSVVIGPVLCSILIILGCNSFLFF